MTKTQIFGIVLFIIAISGYYLNDNYFPDFILGILAAFGFGFIFKFIPFKKRKVTD